MRINGGNVSINSRVGNQIGGPNVRQRGGRLTVNGVDRACPECNGLDQWGTVSIREGVVNARCTRCRVTWPLR